MNVPSEQKTTFHNPTKQFIKFLLHLFGKQRKWYIHFSRFEVSTVMRIQVKVSWVVMPCSAVVEE